MRGGEMDDKAASWLGPSLQQFDTLGANLPIAPLTISYTLEAIGNIHLRVLMKAFILACAAAIVVAGVAVVALDHLQEPAQQAFATSAVRL
jgi:hypothetical protein